jgi:shikimate dehydrogenase
MSVVFSTAGGCIRSLAAGASQIVRYYIERQGIVVNSDSILLSGNTLVHVMIGHPVTQVRSPTTFNKYFREKQMDRIMIAIDIQPEFVGHFFSLLRGWRNCPGCIVTIPYKQEAAHSVDELSDRARDLEAVNVIRRTEKRQLIGDMVDGLGFLEALHSNGFEVSGRRVVVFGAGGAGGAIAYSVAQAKAAEVVVIDTDIGRQEHLLDLLALRFPSVSLSHRLDSFAGVDLAVNATPLGMNGDPRTPFPPDSLDSLTFVADVVTEPDITPWLAAAKAHGCAIQTGYEMTLGQFTFMGHHMGIEFH